MVKTDYDVVVVGSGPMGLSVGSELSKEFKVLIVEKRSKPGCEAEQSLSGPKNEIIINKQTRTSKSWFVPLDSVSDNQDLMDKYIGYDEKNHYLQGKSLAYGGVRRFLAKTFSGKTKDKEDEFDLAWKAKLFPSYPYIDENGIFEYWRKIINESDTSSRIVYEHFYRDHVVTKENVTVAFLKRRGDNCECYETEVITVTCKVLLDASGINSEILKDYEREPKKYYWWSVYGCIAKHKPGAIGKGPDGPEQLKVGDYMLWQTFKDTNIDENDSVRHGRPIFEYEILTEDTSFPLILFLRKEKVGRDYMKAEFLDILRNEKMTKPFHDVEIEEFKYGWYPSGGLTLKMTRDRVDFIGDAGSWTTPCGWGMGFILQNYKPYAKALSKLIHEDRLDQQSLADLVKLKSYQKTQFLLNKLATHFLANGKSKQLDKFINLFNIIDPIICEKMFTLKIAPHEIVTTLWAAKKKFTLKEIIDIIPREEYWSLIKDLFRLAVEIVPHLLYRLIFGEWPTKTRNFKVY
ncbi:MAG: NAD(P)-binding protein [Candidatus Anammoxibacter sp.]